MLGANSEVYRLWAFLGLALLVPAIHAARALLGLDGTRGRVVYGALVCGWTLAAALRFGHV